MPFSLLLWGVLVTVGAYVLRTALVLAVGGRAPRLTALADRSWRWAPLAAGGAFLVWVRPALAVVAGAWAVYGLRNVEWWSMGGRRPRPRR